jgi:hypothetical protein
MPPALIAANFQNFRKTYAGGRTRIRFLNLTNGNAEEILVDLQRLGGGKSVRRASQVERGFRLARRSGLVHGHCSCFNLGGAGQCCASRESGPLRLGSHGVLKTASPSGNSKETAYELHCSAEKAAPPHVSFPGCIWLRPLLLDNSGERRERDWDENPAQDPVKTHVRPDPRAVFFRNPDFAIPEANQRQE